MFEPGQRVAWSHAEATKHAAGSVLRASALPPETPCGTVVGAANEAGTWWVVAFAGAHARHPAVRKAAATHPGRNTLVLTGDELVRIAED